MTKTICALTLLAGLAVAAPARAQTPAAERGATMISINAGAQLKDHPFTTANSFPLFDETASFSSAQTVGKGPLFDASVSRATGWRNLEVSVGFFTFSKKSNASVTATIPHPVFFGRDRTATTEVSDLKRSEVGFNLSAVWAMPLNEKMEVAFSFGPSFIRVSQELVPTVTADVAQNATPVVVKQKATGKGINIGVDFSYHLVSRYSAGAFVRYAGGVARLESHSSFKIGGVQAGGGLRVRF